ncbi:AMP-binding protein [Gordonia lacunae]|uniref:2,3-dihydroxybenzoate-AMP ligase n=1 Tax=Gordonia lacunae TaxID=417102 RepID=A0A243Q8T6_9ACTN|nr:AMP-binding protein [Gordonia lacunae]OUC78092.1 2,3-dihydroxybenzoate-AMP ligase [Gordonia lacunae]
MNSPISSRGFDPSQAVANYPRDLVQHYQDVGYWEDRTIAEQFRAVAAAWPDRDAVATADAAITFAELDKWADRVAYGLSETGTPVGSPVILQLTNRIETIVMWYALLKAGLIPVCTLAVHREHELGQISRQVGAVGHVVDGGYGSLDLVQFGQDLAIGHPTLRTLVVVGAHTEVVDGALRFEDLGSGVEAGVARARVDSIQSTIDFTDVAVLQISGGTTGIPKVIPRLHAEYWYNAQSYADAFGFTEQTRNGHGSPVIHNAGVVCAVHGPHSVGGCTVLAPSPEPTGYLRTLRDARATHALIGTSNFRINTHPDFGRTVRGMQGLVLAGATVPSALFDAIDRLGVPAGQLFGMGEGLFSVSRFSDPRLARATTVGNPLSPDDVIEILNVGSEVPVPDGQTGELCTAGPYTLRGYVEAGEANVAAFTSAGLYRTGDMASWVTIDGARYLQIRGRIKDLINRGGEKVNAAEVESLLLRHPAVTDAAVVAMPDPRLGERACAFLTGPGDHVNLDQVRQHLSAIGVAKYKWPERIEWVSQLPRTAVNKIDKKRLRVLASELADGEWNTTRGDSESDSKTGVSQ